LIQELSIMKFLATALVVATVIAAPVSSFAQFDQQNHREQVRAELAQLEQVNYGMNDELHYPANIQEAEAKVAERNAAAQALATSYGGVVAGTTGSGVTLSHGK
jgi:outer membrane lipoprotein-sorting protein